MIGVLRFDSRWELGIFLFTTAFRTALGPTQPPIQWVPRALSLGIKRPRCEADHSPPSSAEVEEWVDLYLHSPNTPSWRGAQLKKKHKDNFTFTFLTTWCRILFEKLTVTQLVKKYSAFFMEPEGSLPCSQKPATEPYSVPNLMSFRTAYVVPKNQSRSEALWNIS
jgi:hypothetical protein